jgi:protein-S-isoprenylcysteine O-methyltransferase Ste14
MDDIMVFASARWWWVILLTVITFFFLRQHYRINGILATIALIITFCLTDMAGNCIKDAVSRPRPYFEFDGIIRMLEPRGGNFSSFVSNHAANIFGIATVSSLIFKRKLYTVCICVWALTVGYSRIYVGKHYVMDVIAGALLGLSTGYLMYKIYSLGLKKLRCNSLIIKNGDDKIIHKHIYLIFLTIYFYIIMTLKETFEKQGNWLFRYRGILPIIFLFAGIAVHIHTERYPETFVLEKTPYEIYYELLCLVISLTGLSVRIYTVGHTPANTSGRNTAQGQIADMLNTTGIYSIVRHPLYLGNFLMWLGICLITGNFWFIAVFCIIYWVYYERIMYAEEEFLNNKFGADYAEWTKKTPAFLPKFKLFVKPALAFSWKKVLRQEKNGFFALFLVFSGFNVIGEWIEKQYHYNYFLLGMCIVSAFVYCILKYLKKRTTFLNEKGR